MEAETLSAEAVVARDAIKNVCAGRDDRIAEFYDEEFVDYVNGMVFRGHEGGRESIAFYKSLFRPLRFEVDEQVAQGDRVASRWTLYGTNRGRQVELHGIVISRIQDGRIVEDHAISDTLALPRALGVWRTLAVLVDIVRGRVKVPKGAIGGSPSAPLHG
jgi:ketosteroid isomerase-like protein